MLACFAIMFIVGWCMGSEKEQKKIKKSVVETHKETSVEVIRDTVFISRLIPTTVTVVDSVFVIDSSQLNKVEIKLPLVQKQFSDSLFNLWISGVEPLALDSICVYPQKEIITNNITQVVSENKFKLYVGGVFCAVGGTFAPNVSISLVTPRKWLISAILGLYDKRTLYGVQLQYKIR